MIELKFHYEAKIYQLYQNLIKMNMLNEISNFHLRFISIGELNVD